MAFENGPSAVWLGLLGLLADPWVGTHVEQCSGDVGSLLGSLERSKGPVQSQDQPGHECATPFHGREAGQTWPCGTLGTSFQQSVPCQRAPARLQTSWPGGCSRTRSGCHPNALVNGNVAGTTRRGATLLLGRELGSRSVFSKKSFGSLIRCSGHKVLLYGPSTHLQGEEHAEVAP